MKKQTRKTVGVIACGVILTVIAAVVFLYICYPRASHDISELDSVTVNYFVGDSRCQMIITDEQRKTEIYDAISSSSITYLNLMDPGDDPGAGGDGISVVLSYSDGQWDTFISREQGSGYLRYIYPDGDMRSPTGVETIKGDRLSEILGCYLG